MIAYFLQCVVYQEFVKQCVELLIIFILFFLLRIILIRVIFIFQNWELVILEKIKWEVSVATPMDFTDHILLRLGIPQMTSEIQLDELKLR